MKRIFSVLMIAVFLVALVPVPAAAAQAALPLDNPPAPFTREQLERMGCQLSPDGVVPQILICLPPPAKWAGALVLYAHGYVNPYYEKVIIPWDQMVLVDTSTPTPTQVFLPTLVTGMGYAFAATSYSKNGLVVLEALDEMVALKTAAQALIQRTYGAPAKLTFMAGASEGGLITTLSIERKPFAYSGGLSMCGPVGSFQKQINYWANFRAVYDALYPYTTYPLPPVPPALPPDAFHIPPELVVGWYKFPPTDPSPLKLATVGTAMTDVAKVAALLKVTRAPIDAANPAATTFNTIGGLLDYDIFASMNGQQVLGGIPFSNIGVVYSGSGSAVVDAQINAAVTRYAADQNALEQVKKYETRGGWLWKPLVNMHTTGDEIVPYWHARLYMKKLSLFSYLRFLHIPVNRYGHCNFTQADVLTGFGALYLLSTGKLPPFLTYANLLPEQQRGQYIQEMQKLEKEQLEKQKQVK